MSNRTPITLRCRRCRRLMETTFDGDMYSFVRFADVRHKHAWLKESATGEQVMLSTVHIEHDRGDGR